jgi:quinolinate synthase
MRTAPIYECSMSDNVAMPHPGIDAIRPSNLRPLLKRIALAKLLKRIALAKLRSALKEMRREVITDFALAAPARRTVERMLAL